jgi:hypothetical protein
MRGKIHRTPLLESIALNNLAGARVLVKAEALQKVCTWHDALDSVLNSLNDSMLALPRSALPFLLPGPTPCHDVWSYVCVFTADSIRNMCVHGRV